MKERDNRIGSTHGSDEPNQLQRHRISKYVVPVNEIDRNEAREHDGTLLDKANEEQDLGSYT